MTDAEGARPSPIPAPDQLIAEIRREFPNFELIPKRRSLFARAIDIALRIVTLNAQREFLTRYHTVLFGKLYLPDAWDTTPDLARLVTLCHERVHLRQRRRYGDFLMTFLYLIPFFPLGLAYGRARMEWEAYAETLRATAQYAGLEAARSPALREYIVRQFVSGAYGWMWPFPRTVKRWYDEALTDIERRVGGPERRDFTS
jgi:hypothetical protein